MITDLPNTINVTDYNHTCVISAANRFDLPVRALYALLKVEGGKIGSKNYNSNGTYDMGPMQINSIWLPTFRNYLSEDEIIYDGCKNILAGAWILKAKILQAGDFWLGIGNYHSKTKHRNKWYQWQVYKASLSIR